MADFEKDADYYFSKGNQLFDRKEYDKAIISAHLSLKTEFDDIVYLNIATSYCMKGDFRKAAKNFALSLAINPDSSKVWNGVGFCLFNLGKYNEAILKFKKTVEVDPKYTLGYLNWGLSLYCMKEEAEAALVIEEALKKSSLSTKGIVDRYELQVYLAEERLARVTNEEEKMLLKEQICGYRWMMEFVPKKMEELEKEGSENN